MHSSRIEYYDGVLLRWMYSFHSKKHIKERQPKKTETGAFWGHQGTGARARLVSLYFHQGNSNFYEAPWGTDSLGSASNISPS